MRLGACDNTNQAHASSTLMSSELTERIDLMQRVSPCSTLTIVQLRETTGTRKKQMECLKTHGKMKVTFRSKGKGLTVTSACDLGEACHLGLYLLHAVIAQRVALPQQAHACTKFHHCFQHSQRLKRVFLRPSVRLNQE